MEVFIVALVTLLAIVATAIGANKVMASQAVERQQVRQRREQIVTEQTAFRRAEAARLRRRHDAEAAAKLAFARQRVEARHLQEVILTLKDDPDFRRAASVAEQSQQVPKEFRLRQYYRLRPLIVRHYAHCIRRGRSVADIDESLQALISALGGPDYEGDYIRQEVATLLPNHPGLIDSPATSEFQSELAELQNEHQGRLAAIRSVDTLSADVREQLLEAEERRFQVQLFQSKQH